MVGVESLRDPIAMYCFFKDIYTEIRAQCPLKSPAEYFASILALHCVARCTKPRAMKLFVIAVSQIRHICFMENFPANRYMFFLETSSRVCESLSSLL